MKLSDDAYKVLKWIALIALPALATFLAVVGQIWDISWMGNVCATITALGVLIGTLIGVSNHYYYKDKEDGDNGTV